MVLESAGAAAVAALLSKERAELLALLEAFEGSAILGHLLAINSSSVLFGYAYIPTEANPELSIRHVRGGSSSFTQVVDRNFQML